MAEVRSTKMESSKRLLSLTDEAARKTQHISFRGWCQAWAGVAPGRRVRLFDYNGQIRYEKKREDDAYESQKGIKSTSLLTTMGVAPERTDLNLDETLYFGVRGFYFDQKYQKSSGN